MTLVKINKDFSNINDAINTITYCESDDHVSVEYGIKYLSYTKLTVPIVTIDFNNPMEAIRGLLDLMKVYNAGVESGKRRCSFVNDKHNDVNIMDTSLGKMLNEIDDPDVWIKIMDRINNAFIEQDRTIMDNGDVDTNTNDIHTSP